MSEQYFANKPDKELAADLMKRIDDWSSVVAENGYLDKIKDAVVSYHGASYTSFNNSHKVTFGGEQGELTQIGVNHLRNLGEHMLNMTTANRPSLEARAVNADFKSLSQANLANGLLDYYMREKRMEKYIKTAVEYAIVMGAGFVKMTWDATVGKEIERDEEAGVSIYQGDVKFTNLSPFDVVFDSYREDTFFTWLIIREWKSKHDVAAQYPEYHDQIINIETKDMQNSYIMSAGMRRTTDLIPVYTLYHDKTAAVPEGKEVIFLTSDIVLSNQVLPYSRIPVYRIAAKEVLGTPFGYSPLFDLMPLQEAINSLYSSILTNNTAFSVQNLFVPTGANLNMSSLGGQLNIIEGLNKPEALQLTATAPETFQFLAQLEKTIETLSGINSVTRGNPDANLKSGTALALVQSMAVQFISGLQQQYVQLMEDMGTGLIELLKDYASYPRVASIVGKGNRTYLKEFKGEDLSEINRVIVDVGNPLARTTAGRIQMAEQMMQMKADSFTIEQYLQVINTGKIEVMTDDLTREQLLIEQENERLMGGQAVRALALDEHIQHIKQHRSVLADPDLRGPEHENIQNLVLTHVQEHIDMLSSVNPEMLKAIGQQPIAPQQPPQNSNGESPAMQMNQPPGAGQQMPGMPNIPQPPAPFQEMPTSPGMNPAAETPVPPQGQMPQG